MGWWKIKDVASGQVDFDAPTAARTANAVPGKEDVDWLFGGDQPADIMGKALREMSKCYEQAWGRRAKRQELTGVFNFCCNPMFCPPS